MQANDKKDAAENQAPEESEAQKDAAAEGAAPEAGAERTFEPSISDPAAEAAPAAEGPDLAAELADAKDKLLRALAEAENVRRRAQRDVEQASKRAIAGFAREMLTIADNLGRALGAVDKKAAEENEAVKTLLAGVDMTAREMLNAFERNGIQRIDPTGQRFDPQVHEAMFEYDDPSKPAGTVGQVMEPGYLLHGKPLRPAKVGVTKGGPQGAPQSAEKPGESGGDGASGTKSAYEDQGKKPGSQLDEEL